eukprot:s114_g16.t1
MIDPSSGVRTEAPPRSDYADKPFIEQFEDAMGTTKDLNEDQSMLILNGRLDVEDMEVPTYRTGVTGRDVFRLASREVRIAAGAYKALSGDCVILISLSYGKQTPPGSLVRSKSQKAAADGVASSAYPDESMLADSERPKYLTNLDLGLKGSDLAAHSPLVVVSKLHCQRNLRTRSDESDAKRRDKHAESRDYWQETWFEQDDTVGRLRSTTPSAGARYRGQDEGTHSSSARSSGQHENPSRLPVAPPKTPPIPPPSSRRRERSVTPPTRNTQRRAYIPQRRPQPPPQRSWQQEQQYQYQRYNEPYQRQAPRAPPQVPRPPPPPAPVSPQQQRGGRVEYAPNYIPFTGPRWIQYAICRWKLVRPAAPVALGEHLLSPAFLATAQQ